MNPNTAKGADYKGSSYLPLSEAMMRADKYNSDNPKRGDIMEIIEKLIKAGADPNKANVYGSPLLLAITSSNRELVNFLIEKSPKSPKLVLDDDSKKYINSLPEDYEYKQFLKTRFKDMF